MGPVTDILPLAGLLLSSVFVASVIALLRDVHGRRIAERVAAVGRVAAPAPERSRQDLSIRIEQHETPGLLRSLCRLVQFDPAVREQYPLPLPVTFGAGLLVFVVGGRVAGMYLGALPSTLCATAAMLVCLRTLFGAQRARYSAALLRQLPDVTGGIMRAAQAGVPVGEALRTVARDALPPTRQEFARVMNEAALGSGLDQAIARLHHRTGLTEYAFLAVALGMQTQSGGSLAETLDNLSEMVRGRIAVAARARALAGEARTSAFILGGLPFVTSFALFFLRPGYLDMFVTTEAGRHMLTLAATLLTIGILVIRWIIRKNTTA